MISQSSVVILAWRARLYWSSTLPYISPAFFEAFSMAFMRWAVSVVVPARRNRINRPSQSFGWRILSALL